MLRRPAHTSATSVAPSEEANEQLQEHEVACEDSLADGEVDETEGLEPVGEEHEEDDDE